MNAQAFPNPHPGNAPYRGDRTATVGFEKTWFERPLDWSLRIAGPSVGGYGVVDHLTRHLPTARYATEEAALRAASVWIATGVTPAFQGVS